MAASKEPGDLRPAHPLQTEAIDTDVDFAGYDPYIVAITGGTSAAVSSDTTGTAEQGAESRKVKLMAWLREHGA